jgi:hypothetical protein
MNEKNAPDRTDRERLAAIEAIVLRMEQRLLGNGQPGIIDKLERRVTRLESWFWRAAGAIGLAVFILEISRL